MSTLNSNSGTATALAVKRGAGLDLMIRAVTGQVTSVCALCGRSTEIENGSEVYDYATKRVVCLQCAEPIDKAIVDLAAGKTNLREGDYFGDCPKCGDNDGYLNVGRVHFFVCHAHKLWWCVGSNLFSSWKDEDEDEWRKNDATLRTFRGVDDWHRWLVEERPRLESAQLDSAELDDIPF